MNHASLLALTHNATLLLAMIFIYDMATSRSRNSFDSLWKVFMALLLADWRCHYAYTLGVLAGNNL